MKKTILCAALTLLALPLLSQVVLAQEIPVIEFPTPSPIITPIGPENPGELTQFFVTVVQWFYTIIFIVAVLFILLSAFGFITSKGNPEKVAKAKAQLLYAVIGIAVALISYTIIELVRNTIEGNL